MQIIRLVGTGLEDCYKSQATEINTSGFISAGNASDVLRHAGMIFRNFQIPRRSTITSAVLTLTANANLSGTTCNTRIYGEANTNPSQFSNYTDFNSRSLTTAYVDWSGLASWTTDSEYNSPDLSSIIQELVNRSDWYEGRDIALYWKDNSSSTNARRAAYGVEDSTTKCAKLTVDYIPSTHIGMKISKAGYDVKTTGNENLVMTTIANQWKIHMKGSVNFTQANQTITVAHGLGYTPAYLVFTKASGYSYYSLPNINNVCNETNLKLVGQNGDTSSYIIFVDIGA